MRVHLKRSFGKSRVKEMRSFIILCQDVLQSPCPRPRSSARTRADSAWPSAVWEEGRALARNRRWDHCPRGPPPGPLGGHAERTGPRRAVGGAFHGRPCPRAWNLQGTRRRKHGFLPLKGGTRGICHFCFSTQGHRPIFKKT